MSTCTDTIQAQYDLIVATYPNYGPQEVLNAVVSASKGSCSCSQLIAGVWNVAISEDLFPDTMFFSEEILMLARAIGLANLGCDCSTIYDSFNLIVFPAYTTDVYADICSTQDLVTLWAQILQLSQCGTIGDVADILFDKAYTVTQVTIALAAALYNINDIAAVLRDYFSVTFPSYCNFVASGMAAAGGSDQFESYLIVFTGLANTVGDYMIFAFDMKGQPIYPCQISLSQISLTTAEVTPYTSSVLAPSASLCQANITTICSYQALTVHDNAGNAVSFTWPMAAALNWAPIGGTPYVTVSAFSLPTTQQFAGFVQCGANSYFIVKNVLTGLFNFMGNTTVQFGAPGDAVIAATCCDNSNVFVTLKSPNGVVSLYQFTVTVDFDLASMIVVQHFNSYRYAELACNQYMFFNSTTNSDDNNKVVIVRDGLISCSQVYGNGFEIVQTLAGVDKVFVIAQKDQTFYLFAFNMQGAPLPSFGFSIGTQGHHLVEVQELPGKTVIVFSDREPITIIKDSAKCQQHECNDVLLQHNPDGYYLGGHKIGTANDTLLASVCCELTTTFVLLSDNMLYQFSNANGLTSFAVTQQAENIFTYAVGTEQFIFSIHPANKTFGFCPVSLGNAQPVSKVTTARGCIFVLLTLLDSTKSIVTLNQAGDIVSVIPVKDQKSADQYWNRLNGK